MLIQFWIDSLNQTVNELIHRNESNLQANAISWNFLMFSHGLQREDQN